MKADFIRHSTAALESDKADALDHIGGAPVLPQTWEDGVRLSADRPPATLIDCVLSIASQHFTAPAVIAGNGRLRYDELASTVTAVAATLIAAGVKTAEPVGLSLQPSTHLVVGYLGIMAAGAVVMPLDPLLPGDRLRDMARAAGATFALVDSQTTPLLSNDDGLKLIDVSEIDVAANTPLRPAIDPQQAAVLYHTSGSTGRPKPVAISHRTLADRMVSMTDWFGLAKGEVISGTSSLAFDPFMQQLFFPLLVGGTLWLPTRAVLLDGPAFWRDVAAVGLNHLNMVPSQVEALLESGPDGGIPSLTRVVMGGERMPPDLPMRIRERLGDVDVYNMYGPTECTVDATGFKTDTRSIPPEIPIGCPLPGCRVRLLDENLQRVAVGEAGEICIGGAGLAIGYAGMPEETAKRFIPDPYGKIGDRLYRTGDLGRWQADGTLSFIGRGDEQVKVRGQRLELGEVEAALRRQPGVTAAAALLWKDAPGGAAIVAYITAAITADAPPPDTALILKELARTLPPAAVPVRLILIDDMPHLPSGKIDRKALPLPDDERPYPARIAVNRNDLERAVSDIWAELLNGAAPAPHANLFDAGAHSLLVVRAQPRLSALAGREISTVDIFRYPTIVAFAGFLAGNNPETMAAATVPRIPADDSLRAPIAVIGLAFRLPGADDAETLWSNLLAGTDSTHRFTREELDAAGADPELTSHPDFVPVNAGIDGLDRFDPLPFGYTPADAAEMDPQQRLLLETAWQALETASCNPAQDGPVGVFAGVGFNAYLLDNLYHRSGFAGGAGRYFLVVNNDKDFAATRLAYKLGLNGPAMTVATACSTGLATVAQAVDSLRLGRCRVAVAGAASAGMFSPFGYIHAEGGISSREGVCRPFDAAADGTIGGAGAGVVVLKRLSDALADSDTIHAIIRGVGITNDGAQRAAFSAPAVDGQAAAIRAALEDAAVPPSAIGYVEGHGTATPMGDPIEVTALNLAYAGAPSDSIVLGSIKGNIGHLDTAAGMAGLIKAILTVKNGQIAPIAHFTAANPAIPFAQGPFRPATATEPFPQTDGPRLAGVSSFGMGGTNLHLIIEQPPGPNNPPRSTAAAPQLFAVSGASESARDRLASDLATRLETDDIAIADVAHSLNRRRRLPWRRFAIAGTAEAAAAALRGESGITAVADQKTGTPPAVALLFPGQGAQHPGMGGDLYRSYPRFRAVIDEAARHLPGYGEDLAALLLADRNDASAAARLADTRLTQPALFAVEYGIARLLEDFGIIPAALAGHSIGEYVAATLAGVMNFNDALALVALRGRLMAEAPKGAMLAVSMPEADVSALLAEDPAPPEIAVINGPRQCVVAGLPDAIERLEKRLEAQGRPARRLAVSHAFHCALLDPILPAFGEAVAKVALRPAARPILSNLTGGFADPTTHSDPAYWVRHLRGTVRFADNLRHLLEDPARVLVEAGPGQTLTRFARAAGAGADRVLSAQLVNTAGGEESGATALLATIGQLWLRGVEPDWSALTTATASQEGATCPPRRIPLPTYPFERKRYWVEPIPRTAQATVAPVEVVDDAPKNILVKNTNITNSTPENPALDAVLMVWREAIGRDDIEPDDDFLDLGGDSLVAVRIAARLREATGFAASAAAIFTHRTAAGLANSLAPATFPHSTDAPAREEGWL